jgi:pimeloyl-ACP methyl ester carboxylesterase
MPEKIPIFRSLEIEAQYNIAYEDALKKWPIPYDELSIATRFGDTHVIASGPKEAPPLVLLQPAGAGAIIWYRNIGQLSQQYRTYAIDTISEVNKSILTRPIKDDRQDFADWIIDLFKGLNIEKADIVGNSFGGFLTILIAIDMPELVNKMVLISPAATFVMMWPSFWNLFIPAHVIAPLIGSERLVRNAYEWVWQGFPQDDCIAQLRTITALNRLPRHGPPTVFSDMELGKIRTPALLLIGDHEVNYRPKDVIRRATRLVTGLKAEIVPNANHNAEYTAADVVNKKILDFLAD